MKHFILFALLIVPAVVFAQKNKMTFKERRAQSKHEWEVKKQQVRSFNTGMDETGYYLQKAAKNYGLAAGIGVGGAVLGGILAGAADGDDSMVAAGAGVGGAGIIAGLIVYMAGNKFLNKAGNSLRENKITFTGNAIKFTF